ncbi:VOC family protein [Cytobacillus sp. S13-E01]|uniref:VOC family protein n=1 Tax=Cytobacillus sp. S13-E01 TaxID=3031326 RepID=UPI0023D86463|nr:VOC family protein [Cytobacillus sp. S13-E01]MDF0726377.1 VOC family protein [Cytobacillus sp. S13-E01]
MKLQFDHIVHLTKNPEKAMLTFNQLGFNAIQGGNHPNWGTHNRLCYFEGLRYIEWIGMKDRKVAEVSDNVLIQQIVADSRHGEGFSQLAFRTNEIDKLALHFKEKGLLVIGPVAGSRKREDGSVLKWSMLFIHEENTNDLRYPFFIEWGQPDDFRLKEMDALIQHKASSLQQFTSIHFMVKDQQTAVEKFRTLFGTDEGLVKGGSDYTYGDYLGMSIGGIALKFFKATSNNLVHDIRSERPFLCEITSTSYEKTINISGGLYTFTKIITDL